VIIKIRELQNAGSYRKGTICEVKNLTSAKRVASRNQCFQGTVLVIENEVGVRIAIKKDGEWI